jgi:hypothetical protein
MGKSSLTHEIERALINRANNQNYRYALEVDVGGGIVDCLMSKVSYYVDDPAMMFSYEIKISKSDFKSKNGHNFYTHYNFYVVPKKLYPKIKDLVDEHIGILVYNPENYGLRKVKDSKYKNMNDQTIIMFQDKMLLKWVSGSMYAEFQRNGHKFNNDVLKCPQCKKNKRLDSFYSGMCYECYIKQKRLERQQQQNLFKDEQNKKIKTF